MLDLSMFELFIREERFLFNYFRLLFDYFLSHVWISSLRTLPFLLKLDYLVLLSPKLLILSITLTITLSHHLLLYMLNLSDRHFIHWTLPQCRLKLLTIAFRLVKCFEVGLIHIINELCSNLLGINEQPLCLWQHLIELPQVKFFAFTSLTQWEQYFVPGCQSEFI